MATGTTPITYSLTSGTLPSGITLSSNGTLSGTPAAGTVGVYPVVFTASNGGSLDQAFTLDVFGFTSPSSRTIAIGAPMSFAMTTLDGSAPATISIADTLPAGLTFSNGVFSGTPLLGTGGTYTLHADANDGIDDDATQTFTLNIVPPNVIYVSNSNFGQASAPNVGDADRWRPGDRRHASRGLRRQRRRFDRRRGVERRLRRHDPRQRRRLRGSACPVVLRDVPPFRQRDAELDRQLPGHDT